jgi:hypothetical protein
MCIRSLCVLLFVAFFSLGGGEKARAADSKYELIAQKVLRLRALETGGATLTGKRPNDREMQRLHAEVRQLINGSSTRSVATPQTTESGGILKRGQEEYYRQHGIEPKPPDKKEVSDFCVPKNNLYVRADRLDTYLYGIPSLDGVKGASISYTNDRTNDHATTSISGVVSYVLYREICRDPAKGRLITDSYLSG